jgi:RNA polymerase sigma-70 factor (ECF subfamily)
LENDNLIKASESFLLKHDLDSFKVIYNHYYRSLCFFAHEYLKDGRLVEDTVQDVFSQIWEKAPKLNDSAKLQGYLYAMVRNRSLNILRSNDHFQKYQEHELNTDTWEEDESLRLVKSEVYREIMQSIERLPQRAREVFELSYLTQLREHEVALRLNISVNSVKTHKKRARSILKDELKHLFSLIMILKL